MAKTIALCGVNEEITHTLERYGGYRLLNFYDEPERRGDVKLAYSMLYGIPVTLAIVGYSGAEGLAACDYLRTQSLELPILWLCDRKEFESEAMRLGVSFYSTGSPVVKPTIAVILKKYIRKFLKEEQHEKKNFKHSAMLLHSNEPDTHNCVGGG